jgi:hypothetical protein
MTTTNTMNTTLTLLSTGTLKSRLTKLSSNSKINTLSLAYYTMIHGNVSPLIHCESTISSVLDPVYRQFVCAKFDAEKGQWVYSKAKGKGLIDKMNLEYTVTTFSEFVDAIEAYDATLVAKKAESEANKVALDPAKVLEATKERVLNYLVNCELSEIQLKDIMLLVNSERASGTKHGKVNAIVPTTAPVVEPSH